MAVSLRFLISPSLSRLIRREYGSEQIREGYFVPQSGRQSHIKISATEAQLVLTSLDAEPAAAEDYVELPRAHAEAMLQVSAGTLAIERSVVPLRDHRAFVDRFFAPGPLDLVSVDFGSEGGAADFVAPVWFGADVSHEEGYLNRVMALSGLPSASVVEASNAALEALLDIIEGNSNATDFAAGPGEQATAVVEIASHAPVAALAIGLPRARVVSGPHENTQVIAEPRPRETPDKQLASVIRGLSAALSDTRSEADEEEQRSRPRWKRMSH